LSGAPYDQEGNLTKKSKGASAETWTYGYNNRNAMVWAKDAATDGGAALTYVSYKYDALGNRIEEDVWTSGTGTVTTDYAYDGQNVWADTTSGGSLQMRRLYANAVDAVLARIDSSGNAAWYLTDRQGSVRDIDKADGSAVLDHLDYDGWGKVTDESSPSNGDGYKYAGGVWDAAVQLQHNGARDYDPRTGRWQTEDPTGFNAGDSNLYRYVNNGPTNGTDPSGLRVARAPDGGAAVMPPVEDNGKFGQILIIDDRGPHFYTPPGYSGKGAPVLLYDGPMHPFPISGKHRPSGLPMQLGGPLRPDAMQLGRTPEWEEAQAQNDQMFTALGGLGRIGAGVTVGWFSLGLGPLGFYLGGAWSLDQITTGWSQITTGTPQQSLGGQLIHNIAGDGFLGNVGEFVYDNGPPIIVAMASAGRGGMGGNVPGVGTQAVLPPNSMRPVAGTWAAVEKNGIVYVHYMHNQAATAANGGVFGPVNRSGMATLDSSGRVVRGP
jgi:RHS repeat-associated protein